NAAQFFDELVRVRNLCSVDDEADHDLPSLKSAADQDMAEESRTHFFVVGLQAIFFHKVKHDIQYLCIDFFSERAGRVWDDLVCAARIKSCGRTPLLVCPDGILRFVPVVKRLFHSTDRFHHCI